MRKKADQSARAKMIEDAKRAVALLSEKNIIMDKGGETREPAILFKMAKNGRFIKRSFSVKKYGVDEAIRLAREEKKSYVLGLYS